MPYKRSAQFGGTGGDAFSDNLTETLRLMRVTVRHAAYVDSIQCEWLTVDGSVISGPRHGGGGGNSEMFALGEGEYITAMFGRADKFVDQIAFITNLGRVFGPYGGTGGQPFKISGIQAGGFFGRSAAYLDAIGVFSPVGATIQGHLSHAHEHQQAIRHGGVLVGDVNPDPLRPATGVPLHGNHLSGAFH